MGRFGFGFGFGCGFVLSASLKFNDSPQTPARRERGEGRKNRALLPPCVFHPHLLLSILHSYSKESPCPSSLALDSYRVGRGHYEVVVKPPPAAGQMYSNKQSKVGRGHQPVLSWCPAVKILYRGNLFDTGVGCAGTYGTTKTKTISNFLPP